MNTLFRKAAAAGVLALATGSMSAIAAPLPYLTYQQHAGWDENTSSFFGEPAGMSGLEFNNPTVGAGYAPNTFTNISWYGQNDTGPSSIDIVSHNQNDTPSSLANPGQWAAGEWAIITTLTQTNNVLSVNSASNVPETLWIADAVANLEIYDNTGTNLLYGDVATNGGFNVTTIEFWETPNVSPCQSPQVFGTTCDDIFRVTALSLAPVQFENDGYEYTIDFTLLPGPITDNGVATGEETVVCTAATCEGLGIPAGEIWVFTPEYNPGTSTLFVAMQYSVRQIPEPSVVALVALGLLGLGMVARRRREYPTA